MEISNASMYDGSSALAESALMASRISKKKRFLILPHPDVAKYMDRKANNRERWIAGMQRFRQSVTGQTD